MKSLRVLSAGVVCVALPFAACAVEPAAWVKKWEDYAKPKNNFVMLVTVTRPQLSSVLAHLPPSGEWAALSAELAKAEELAAPDATRRRRLQAGRWLIDEMIGRGDQVAAEINASLKKCERRCEHRHFLAV